MGGMTRFLMYDDKVTLSEKERRRRAQPQTRV